MSTLFDAAYSGTGRPGVPPERLLKALLPQAIYSVRSETQPALPQEDRGGVRLDQDRRGSGPHEADRPVEDRSADAVGGRAYNLVRMRKPAA